MKRLLLFSALVLGTLSPTTAHAKKSVIGATMSYGIDGGGQDLRLRYGLRWRFATVMVQPEILGGVTLSDGESVPIAMAGLTVGAGPLVQPRVFARMGAALAGDTFVVQEELGVAVVFTSIPKIGLGLTAAYNGILTDGELGATWWSGGVEASFAF
jgi:hypothetical protein